MRLFTLYVDVCDVFSQRRIDLKAPYDTEQRKWKTSPCKTHNSLKCFIDSASVI